MKNAKFHLVLHYAKVWQYQSGIVLVLMNLIPLVGVIFFGWSGFTIVFWYWSENVIIGFFNVLKMLVVGAVGDPRPAPKEPPDPAHLPGRLLALASMIFFAVFFTLHYGIVTWIHGIFVAGYKAMRNAGRQEKEPQARIISNVSLAKLHSNPCGI